MARLNEEDRWARAITRYPNRSDAEVHSHLAEFHDRIGAVEVEQARQEAFSRTDESESRSDEPARAAVRGTVRGVPPDFGDRFGYTCWVR